MGPFVQVVLGQIISLFGNAALRFVLPLILLRQTGSAAVYGAATALALLPALAGTLAGGVLADRCRKARLMVVLDLAAAGLALGAAASADDLPVILWAPAALCALYALQGLYQPVVRASLPLLLAGVGLYGVLTGTDVFSALTDGARDGLRTVARIFPALVALLTAVLVQLTGTLTTITVQQTLYGKQKDGQTS